MTRTPFRHVHFGPIAAELSTAPDGNAVLRSPYPLGAYPDRLTDRVVQWARVAPERTFVAQRDARGAWRHVSYAETLERIRSIGQGLLERGLSADRPLVILSENSIEHALLALGAMHAGVLYSPVSPAYSLLSSDFGKLRYILDLLKPGLVFAREATRFARALEACVPAETGLVFGEGRLDGRRATSFDELAGTPATAALDEAHRLTGPDTVAKILFTSGSTGAPKGVINTQRMLCANQQMILQTMAFLGDAPPVLLDWSPWHHTAGGNHNFGAMVYNGGTFYVDDGKPVPALIEKTVQNLRDVAPTFYFNVPKGYEELIPYFEREPALKKNFFSRLNIFMYAGAGMSQHVWDGLDRVAVQACGERILIITGLGSTETAPSATFGNWDTGQTGVIGLPVPGVEVKLVPGGGKVEVRFRAPSVTPGYWRHDELTKAAFDEDGFYRMGDAVRYVDPDDPRKGLIFDGRIAEDFKLSTGTWVNVGALRNQVILEGAPHVQDVVIAGHDRDDIAVLIFPQEAACRALCAGLAKDAPLAEVCAHPAVLARFQSLVNGWMSRGTGSSNRIVRALLLAVPPSIDAGEVTDKGSINQRAVLKQRADLVEELYAEERSARVIAAGQA
jgi:feruloyl-CoA synthase